MFHSLKPVLKIILVALVTGFATLPAGADPETDATFYEQRGQQYYNAGDYEAAIEALSEAVKLDPDNSHYHHSLARAYGQLADQSGWFRAYKLSIKTREGLERAVELDAYNVDALRDLETFYERAPEFLGGGKDKAEAIRKRLDELADQGHV